MKSLRNRLLVAASVVLAAFVLMCGLGLEQAFEDSALKAEEDELRGITLALLGAGEPQPDGEFLVPNTDLPDSRLMAPESGLEAAVLDETGTVVWSSPSAGNDLPDLKPAEVNAWRFHRLSQPDRFLLVYGVRWIEPAQDPHRYTVVVIEDEHGFHDQIAAYRRTLW